MHASTNASRAADAWRKQRSLRDMAWWPCRTSSAAWWPCRPVRTRDRGGRERYPWQQARPWQGRRPCLPVRPACHLRPCLGRACLGRACPSLASPAPCPCLCYVDADQHACTSTPASTRHACVSHILPDCHSLRHALLPSSPLASLHLVFKKVEQAQARRQGAATEGGPYRAWDKMAEQTQSERR
jgi:hypothetical protein